MCRTWAVPGCDSGSVKPPHREGNGQCNDHDTDAEHHDEDRCAAGRYLRDERDREHEQGRTLEEQRESQLAASGIVQCHARTLPRDEPAAVSNHEGAGADGSVR